MTVSTYKTRISGGSMFLSGIQMGTSYTVYAQVVNGIAQAGMKAKHDFGIPMGRIPEMGSNQKYAERN